MINVCVWQVVNLKVKLWNFAIIALYMATTNLDSSFGEILLTDGI